MDRPRTTPPCRTAAATLVALLLLAHADPAAAQRPGSRRASRDAGEMGRGFFQAGYLALDLDGLNARLSNAGYPALDDGFVTLGGAGYGTRGRLLIGGEGHGILETTETTANGSHRLSLSGGYGLFRLGWLALARGGVDVFPALGIGGGALQLGITERSAPTFDDVLENPDRSSDLSTAMFLLDASLAVNYRLRVRESEDGGVGGLLLGLQAGYTFAPGDTSWELDGINDVAGGPDLRIEGFWVRLSVGGWGRGDDGRGR